MLSKERTDVKTSDGQKSNGGQAALFVELLEDYAPAPLQRGQLISGELLQIDRNLILADVAAKRTAVVPPNDIAELDEGDLEALSVGDEVMLYVLRTPVGDEDLLVSLKKGFEHQDWEWASECLDSEELLELEVVGYNKGGLLVSFGRLRGFVPTSHIPALQHYRDRSALMAEKSNLLGEVLPLKVIEVNRQRGRLVLSAKKAQSEVRLQRLEELKALEGQTVTGQVTNLVKFGAFVDLDGIEGLVHVSELAWHHVDLPDDYVQPGEEIAVQIKSVDVERERISLSRKALLPNPYQAFAKEYAAGDMLEGVVTNITDFGAFVEVADHVEGLVHVSEMQGTQDFAPQDVLVPGEKVLVRVIDIQPERDRISLSQRRISQTEQIEWTWQQAQAEAALDEEE